MAAPMTWTKTALLAGAAWLGPGAGAFAQDITVFAAASLARALGEIGAQYQADTGQNVVFSFAGSSALARQIQAGAAADIFFPASVDWMQAVMDSGDVDAASRRDVLGGSLVLIAHDPAATPVTLDENLDLGAMLAGGRLAMALPDAVPAGIYAKQALANLGLWARAAPHIAPADSVTGALNFVRAGDAPYGIVYASDVVGADDLAVVATFPEGSHDPIIYPAALTVQARPQAAAFLNFLLSDPAAQIWRRAGFRVLP